MLYAFFIYSKSRLQQGRDFLASMSLNTVKFERIFWMQLANAAFVNCISNIFN